MADFSTEAELSLSVPARELRSAKAQIEEGIGDIELGIGTASQATGGGAGGVGGGGRQRIRWERTRTTALEAITEHVAAIRDQVEEGGGGGGLLGGGLLGGGVAGRVAGGGGGGAILGGFAGVSLSSLITKSSLTSLLTKAPAFATLVQASKLTGGLITGTLTAKDIIRSPIDLGNMLTFGMIDSELITGAIGAVTLTIGGVQIAGALSSMLGSVGIGSVLTGLGAGSLTSLLGSVSVGSILSGLGTAGTTLIGLVGGAGALPIAALIGGTLAGAALLDHFGVIDINSIVEGTIIADIQLGGGDEGFQRDPLTGTQTRGRGTTFTTPNNRTFSTQPQMEAPTQEFMVENTPTFDVTVENSDLDELDDKIDANEKDIRDLKRRIERSAGR